MPERIERVQFRPGDLEEPLHLRIDPDEGGSAEAAAARMGQRDLDRYDMLLDDALRAVAYDLALEEARWIVSAHWSTLLDWNAAVLMPVQLRDFAVDPKGWEYAADWAVDPDALIARVRHWSLTKRMAIIDAMERLHCLMAQRSRDAARDATVSDDVLDDLIVAVGLARRAAQHHVVIRRTAPPSPDRG